ncbi:hypothetical protein KI387_043925 [Taxus chinensis]|uniref:Leucine zipper homeobox-associated domain-containing protein n=1 Tax=Taxus chinensis TaxID=29808 RepID=A0AA38GLC1_TAXCH|nr:hypothetical protein KI387_043925 [Taxus chinensis]
MAVPRMYKDHKPHMYSLPVGEILNLRSLIFMLFGFVGIDISDLQNLQLYLDLSWNALGGSLPEEIGKITMVTYIDISGNKFRGAIPTVVGSCVGLKHLNLSRNALEGLIPENRRVRSKNKQLERNFDVLKQDYEILKTDYDKLIQETKKLKSEIQEEEDDDEKIVAKSSSLEVDIPINLDFRNMMIH